MRYIAIFATIILKCFAQDLIVELPNGKVQGTTVDTPSGKIFYTWRHIPFAKPPLGELRFKSPVSPDPWTGVLNGSEQSPACLFVGAYEGDPVPVNGNSEDCLYINVYSPVEANSSLSLPVIFYIYGGGFIDGASDVSFTDPTSFLEEGVVLVNFNYRLSFWGFLSTEDTVVPGNSGLKDQNAALLWTRENIALFGGNPLDITILGHSSGAVSAGYHLLSPMSKDLFSGAILMSGSSLNYFGTTPARNNALSLAMQVNTSITESSSSLEILQALQAADAEHMVNLTLSGDTKYGPVLEVNNPDAFITQPFYESVAAGNFTKVPIIMGVTSLEKMGRAKNISHALSIAASHDANSSLLFPGYMQLKVGASVETVNKEIKQAFVGNGTFVKHPCSFYTWLSSEGFTRAIQKCAILKSQYTPVYFYQFSFEGTRSIDNPALPGESANVCKISSIRAAAGCGRVVHAEDLGYLFNISTRPILTDADFLTRRRYVKLFSNFVKFKNPTPGDDSVDLLQNVTWERFDGNNLQYLDIDVDLTFKYGRQSNITSFWDYLWATYAVEPYITF